MHYSQLTPAAQERARDWYRENCMDHDDNYWSECTVDEWKEKLAKKGFTDAEIQWSGFYCQGDGASFTAGVKREFSLPEGLVKRIAEMNLVALALERFEGERPEREVSFEVTSVKVERGVHSRGVHAYTINASFEWNLIWRPSCGELWTKLEEELGVWVRCHEKDLTEEARDLSNEIFRDLEAAWDSENSDDSVADALTANDHHFDEDGNRIRERKLAA